MTENDYCEIIEKLNLDYLRLKDSAEFFEVEKRKERAGMSKRELAEKIAKHALHGKDRKILAQINRAHEENGFTVEVDKIPEGKLVVYTCVTGGYDGLKTPMMPGEYVVFGTEGEGWKTRAVPEAVRTAVAERVEGRMKDGAAERVKGQMRNGAAERVREESMRNNKTNVLVNRYIKLHPFEMFGGEYDYAIYVDGNIQPVSDLRRMLPEVLNENGLALHRHRERDSVFDEVEACRIYKRGEYAAMKKQMGRYKGEGLTEVEAKEVGLFECNVIAVDLHNEKMKQIMDAWWEEFLTSGSFRDQIALPYVLWKMSVGKIGDLGRNVYRNPMIRVHAHGGRK